jgi:hypothetical protein
MSQENILKLRKLDVAKRQLETALRLWFADGDPVSIHTLIVASLEVISALLKHKGLKSNFYDSDLIKPEFRKEFNRRVRENANFFKHADLDPDAEREFKPGLNELLMIFAVSGLADLQGKTSTGIEHAFHVWMVLHFPHFLDEKLAKIWNDHPSSELVRKMRKQELLALWEEIQTWCKVVPE